MSKETKRIQLDDRMLMLLEGNLKRIFCLSITRSTLREIQNVILTCVKQDQDLAQLLLECLLKGELPAETLNEKQREIYEAIIRDFTIPIRLAKEVFERGEFINIVTSDLVSQGEQYAFLNRLRRIDGEEYFFMTDPGNMIHLLQHFASRLFELQKQPKGKEVLEQSKRELTVIAERLKQLAI